MIPVTKQEIINQLIKIERMIKYGRDGKNVVKKFNRLSIARSMAMLLREDIINHGLK